MQDFGFESDYNQPPAMVGQEGNNDVFASAGVLP